MSLEKEYKMINIDKKNADINVHVFNLDAKSGEWSRNVLTHSWQETFVPRAICQ